MQAQKIEEGRKPKTDSKGREQRTNLL